MGSTAPSLSREFLVVSLIAASGYLCFAGEAVTDEALRIQALRLAFPNAQISTVPTKPNDHPFSVTDPLGRAVQIGKDVLAGNHEYEVVGPLAKIEEGPASDVTDPKRPLSEKRRVELQVYKWRVSGDDPLLIAVISYSFPNANPPRCCRAIGKALLLSSTADRILDVLDKMPYAFTTFTSNQFIKVERNGTEVFMLGGDFSGVATIGVSSVILTISNLRLKPVMSVTTMILYEAELEHADVHTLTLDERRTLLAGGKRFFFTKKSYVENGNIRRTPLTSTVSFPVGAGLPLDWQ